MTASGHILIVEGNDVTRKLIVGILRKQGYDTYEAANGDEAVAFLNKQPVLVILDVENEDTANIGFLRKLQMEHSRLPVIAMTPDADRKEALRARLGLTVVSFLEKPVVPGKLLSDIEGHLTAGVAKKLATEPREAPKGESSKESKEVQEQRAQHMRRAIDLSQEKMDANCGGPFGAVIVRGGKIIAEGWNEVTSTKDPTAHAEVQAIRKAAKVAGDFSLSGCEIYTSCEPCPMCLAAIYWARIDRIYYANTREDANAIGFDDDFIYREFAVAEHKRTLPARMILRDEAQIVFKQWLTKGDKTEY